MFDLQSNKAILVTGASSGIGQAVSVHLSKLGFKIMLLARREFKLKEIYSTLGGDGHQYISFDLTQLEKIEEVLKFTVEKMGPLSGMVHCAGIAPMRPLNLLKPQHLHEVMVTNFYSYIELVRCFTKKGNFKSPASIVAISSISSLKGSKSKIAYSSSKAAMDAATRCMAKELAPKKIRINTILPAWVQTSLVKEYRENWEDSDYYKKSLEEQFLGNIWPNDIAKIVAFLLSDDSSIMTGISFPADGGRLV